MLEVQRLRAGYGAITILWDVDLSFAAGRLTAIVGPNGAGKTTLLRAISGLLPIQGGDILLRGDSLRDTPAWDMPGRGMILVPEGRLVFKDMTVEDNLLMGAFAPQARPRADDNLRQVYALFPKLAQRRRQAAGSLSGGEAQMLALGRGLMAEPQLLLIDEPSLGLAPVVVREMFAVLAELKRAGKTIVLVEQNTGGALAVADHVYLMQSGKVLLSQAAAEVELDALHDLYFSRGAAEAG
ncbi:ABC transporter ATP-binding protein [Chromobacterium aquaticum]|uniref:ABC transporter ATP-binding protein n=1 Tax=Chromobacterium aquaticum TaxID=467180 RepID=A0ABV8ZU09_9NEIS|nr:ABC transporter ATP-binding protein [Chromobacterium aquaticum]MCD5362545.1 ABC transporter ATP-binding protein [Chromobacterium aquaticum]